MSALRSRIIVCVWCSAPSDVPACSRCEALRSRLPADAWAAHVAAAELVAAEVALAATINIGRAG